MTWIVPASPLWLLPWPVLLELWPVESMRVRSPSWSSVDVAWQALGGTHQPRTEGKFWYTTATRRGCCNTSAWLLRSLEGALWTQSGQLLPNSCIISAHAMLGSHVMHSLHWRCAER